MAPTMGFVSMLLLIMQLVGAAWSSESYDAVLIGAGIAGIAAGKTLSEHNVNNFLILEATDKIGGRMRQGQIAGSPIELGANRVEGVNGPAVNPIWVLAEDIHLRTYLSDSENISNNVYESSGYVPGSKAAAVQNRSSEVFEFAASLGAQREKDNQEDVSILYAQRAFGRILLACIVILMDAAILTVSLGVLQSGLIEFRPALPDWKLDALWQYDMAVYTKIFLKFPNKFWSDQEFFLYADATRGYYPIWQSLEREYPGTNILSVTVTDDESRRIEQQVNNTTLSEAMGVLKKMFGDQIPTAVDIIVPRCWSNRFFGGSFSKWPIGLSDEDFVLIQAAVGRLYFSGEHTHALYNGYVHGGSLAVVKCLGDGNCTGHKYAELLNPSKKTRTSWCPQTYVSEEAAQWMDCFKGVLTAHLVQE